MKHTTTLRLLGIVIVVVLALVVIVLHLVGAENLVQSTTELILIVVSVIGTIAFQLIIWPERFLKTTDTREAVKSVSAEQEKTQGFDLCREEDRPKIEALLNEAERHSTVWVMGVDCTYWLDDYREKVREYVTGLDHDISIIFLVAKPDSVILKTASETKLISRGSKGRIESSIALFQEMKSELREKGGKIQLGICDLPLVHSMVVVNPNTGAERIQVTHYLYRTDWIGLPNLTLRRQLLTKAQQSVFDAYHDSIWYALKNARDSDGKPLVA